MSVCVEATGLTKRFGSTIAVDNLSLEVQSGEVLGLVGPNGAGKSTTLYMLTGLIPLTSGSVSIFGKDLRSAFLEIAPRMGVLVEQPAFYNYLSARENLMIHARLCGRSVTVDRALDRAGLLAVAAKKVGTFSQGMRQRLGIAQALLLEPELLILDEPANGLDPEALHEILELLRTLADEAHVTILVSSHMLHEIENLCDRVAIINKGKLVTCEKTEHLLSYDLCRAEIIVDGPEAVAKRLGTQSWVQSAEVRSGKVYVTLNEPNIPHLASFLVTTGYRVEGIIPQRRTLHEYFLKVLNP